MHIRRSLLVRALALMLAVFMLLFACLFALLYRSARDTVRTQELQNASTRLEMFRAYLDLSLDNGRNTIYQFMQSGLMSSDKQDKIQAYFQRYSETNSAISVKFLFEGDRVLAIDQPLLLNSMTADSAFFYSQAQHNRLVISAPLLFSPRRRAGGGADSLHPGAVQPLQQSMEHLLSDQRGGILRAHQRCHSPVCHPD